MWPKAAASTLKDGCGKHPSGSVHMALKNAWLIWHRHFPHGVRESQGFANVFTLESLRS